MFVSLSTSNQHIVAEATQKKRIHGREVRRIWQQMAGFCRNGISKEVHEKKQNKKEKIPKEKERKEMVRARNAQYVRKRTPPRTAGTTPRLRIPHQERVERAAKQQQ